MSFSAKVDTRITLTVVVGEGNVNGFGLEFFIETPADEIADSVDDIKRSWQFQLLYTVSQLAAGMESVRFHLPSSPIMPMPVLPQADLSPPSNLTG